MTGKFRKERIGVLMGGLSAEREISIRTGQGVLAALNRLGYAAGRLDWATEETFDELLDGARAGVIWNALHGTYGEDGWVQARLEARKLPYTGSGARASETAMDKVRSKEIFREAGIATPEWRVVEPADRIDDPGYGYPLVVKPSREGSTVGVTIVHEPQFLTAAVTEAARHHGQVMVERFIAGAELSVAVLGAEALGSVEIRPRSGFYDYRAKYLSGDTEYLVPAPVAEAVEAAARDLAARSHAALGCSGYSRVDLRLDHEARPWVLEVNTLPGLTETSLFPKIARHAGIDYDSLVERILDTAALKG